MTSNSLCADDDVKLAQLALAEIAAFAMVHVPFEPLLSDVLLELLGPIRRNRERAHCEDHRADQSFVRCERCAGCSPIKVISSYRSSGSSGPPSSTPSPVSSVQMSAIVCIVLPRPVRFRTSSVRARCARAHGEERAPYPSRLRGCPPVSVSAFLGSSPPCPY